MFSFSGLDLKTRSGFGSWGVFKHGWRWSESEHLYSVWIITIGTQAKIDVTTRSVSVPQTHKTCLPSRETAAQCSHAAPKFGGKKTKQERYLSRKQKSSKRS